MYENITTYPNQRIIKIHRERVNTDFLGIKNENWQAAARDLRPFALVLYLYLASNKDNFSLALSPAAVQSAVGLARSTYNDQFNVLVNKGYLVSRGGNTYDFYEVPQPRGVYNSLSSSSRVQIFDDDSTTADNDLTDNSEKNPSENIEINNSINTPNTNGINIEDYLPKVKTITIPVPTVEGKKKQEYVQKEKPRYEFDF